MQKRAIYKVFLSRLKEPRKFIQVLLGPRQIGKTTLALQALKEASKPYHYISADLASLQDLSWLAQQWEVARQKVDPKLGGILVIDEIQKIPHWSDMIKALWDEDTRNEVNLTVAILGSSPWLVQKGLTESLAGRFEVIPVTHWSFLEVHEIFSLSCEEYVYFGGYPGAMPLIEKQDPSRWLHYINDSLVEMTISRDVLLMTQVNKPVLLRRLFQLGCLYSGQILSYTKMLGELDEAGNTTTLAHYLELLSGAGLICGLQKFAGQPVRQKNSSPKLLVYNTALMSAQKGISLYEAKKDPAYWGRLVESAVGAHLLNSIQRTHMELFYWREGSNEVDFVLKKENKLVAIEVKSSEASSKHSGMAAFLEHYPKSRPLLIGPQGLSLQEFLSTPIQDLFGNI